MNVLIKDLETARIQLYKLFSKLKCSVILYMALLELALSSNKFYVAYQLLKPENLPNCWSLDHSVISQLVSQIENLEHINKLMIETKETNYD